MNFFQTVFSDDLTPPGSPTSVSHSASSTSDSNSDPGSNPPPPTSTINLNPWSLGVMIKKLATKSESVIETYRRDLEELGSGLRKETAVIREVASRAVKDLPASLEASASAAQESLETVGQAIDDIGATVWKSTAQIVSHGRDFSNVSSDYYYYDHDSDSSNNGGRGLSWQMKPYSRYEAQLLAMQSNLNTYCTEPEDSQGYGDWRFGFGGSVVEEKREEIEKLLGESEVVREIYDEVMPSKVNIETFWSRYFYRVQKLKEAEEARAKIVKRAISAEEEDLSWDFDDEEDDRVVTNKPSMPIDGTEVVEKMRNESNDRRESGEVGHENVNVHQDTNVEGVKEDGGSWDDQSSSSKKVEEKAGTNGGGEELCKDNDVSVVLKQQQQQQEIEELGWNEIEEDIGDDSSNNTNGEKGDDGAISRVDLRKRLSCAEEEEDLSWDIEDDDDDDGESGKH